MKLSNYLLLEGGKIMHFTYCPYCGRKLISKEIGQEVDSVEWIKYDEALSLLREGSIAWQLVKYVIEND